MGVPPNSAVPAAPTSRRTSRRALTVAIAVALAAPLVAAGPAHAAGGSTPKVKVVKISAKAFPQLLDRPGTSEDVIRVTRTAGAKWTVGATAVAFAGSEKTKDISVTGNTEVTVEAEAATATSSFVISGPTSWSYAPTSTAKEYSVAEIDAALTWNDMPGTKNDSVVLSTLNGISWRVGSTTYDDAKFKGKATLVVKLKDGDTVTPVALGATFASGADAPRAGVTSAATIPYTAEQLAAAAAVGDNPFDKTKGFGKGASVETVKITGLAGIQWKVGSSPKAVNVKPGAVAYVPVPADDLDGPTKTVGVTPVAAAGFTVPTSGTPATATPVSLDFEDLAVLVPLAVPAAQKVDPSGAVADQLVLPGQRGMTWYAGQKDAKGKLAYKAIKVGKDGNAVHKVKHLKGAANTVVYYRAIADRGYEVTGTVQGNQTFSAVENDVSTPTVAGGAASLVAASAGVASWDVTSTIAGKAVKTSYKPADLTAAGATSITVPATSVAVKLVKGYKKG